MGRLNNWLKNLFSKKAKVTLRNVRKESSTSIGGVKVNFENTEVSIGSVSREFSQSPVVMTEDIATKDLQHGQTMEAIESVDNYKKREEYKGVYAETLINERSNSTNIEKKKTLSVDNSCFSCANLKSFLEERDFRSLFLPNDLCEKGTLLWPMNTQNNVTYIHAAQFQLAKLFTLAGWQLKIIIGDCGHNSSKENNAQIEFKKALEDFFTKNDFSAENYKITFLSQYFIRNSENNIEIDQKDLLNEFHSISNNVLWKDYKSEILKEYDDDTCRKIENRKILNNIQPLLIWSVVASINQYNVANKNGKVVVIAGEDEFKQWERIVDTRRRNNLSVIFIQELKTADGKTMNQSEIKITDKIMLRDKINSNDNLAKWIILHFIELPKCHTKIESLPFCKIKCDLNDNNCIKCLFEDGKYKSSDFDFDEFIRYIYPLINLPN